MSHDDDDESNIEISDNKAYVHVYMCIDSLVPRRWSREK